MVIYLTMIRIRKHHYILLILVLVLVIYLLFYGFKDKSLLELNIFYLHQGNNLYLEKNNLNSNDDNLFLYLQPSESNVFDIINVPEPFISRRAHLREKCRISKNISKKITYKLNRNQFEHILVDKKRGILFCYIPKVACTNWKRVFLVLSGKVGNITEALNVPSYAVHSRNLFPSLQNYTTHEIKYFLKNYIKIIFVRNPFERLLSAYRNKLEMHYNSSKYFQSRIGKFIVRNFRKNPSNVSLEKGDDVKFHEFVNYLVSIRDRSFYNEHWRTMSDLCFPCLINYDFIGKFETLADDAEFILRAIQLNMTFPTISKSFQTNAMLKEYYKTLPLNLLMDLYTIYKWDFTLFDYYLNKTLSL